MKYLIIHKWFVFLAGLKTKAPLWNLIIHDWSKILPSEFIPYANFFYNQKLQNKENKDRFNYAWLFHQRRNPHHWQYWYLIRDNAPDFPMKMPEKYVREMVADWAGAGRAITGKWDVFTWYEKNKEKILLNPDTKTLVESLLETFKQ